MVTVMIGLLVGLWLVLVGPMAVLPLVPECNGHGGAETTGAPVRGRPGRDAGTAAEHRRHAAWPGGRGMARACAT